MPPRLFSLLLIAVLAMGSGLSAVPVSKKKAVGLIKAGYATAFDGKAHLGDIESSYLNKRGFDPPHPPGGAASAAPDGVTRGAGQDRQARVARQRTM